MFEKALFSYSAGWLYYTINNERKFVARFKYRNPISPKPSSSSNSSPTTLQQNTLRSWTTAKHQ